MNNFTVEGMKQKIGDYESIKENLICRLSKEWLKNPVYTKEFSNLKVRYDIILQKGMDERISMPISQQLFDLWEIDGEELHQNALKNTENYVPAKMMLMKAYNGLEILGNLYDISEVRKKDNLEMYILTNQNKMYGATSILYPDTLKDLGKIFESDFYMLPSSIHEWIILPEIPEGIDIIDVQNMVKGVNTTLDPKDLLSSDVYRYDKDAHIFICETNLAVKREKLLLREVSEQKEQTTGKELFSF